MCVPLNQTKKEQNLAKMDKLFNAEKDAKITGANDGKKNRFYDFPEWVTNIDTLAEYLELDGYDFNVLKSLTINLGERHAGTNQERELNKRLHYSEMAINKFKRSRPMKDVTHES